MENIILATLKVDNYGDGQVDRWFCGRPHLPGTCAHRPLKQHSAAPDQTCSWGHEPHVSFCSASRNWKQSQKYCELLHFIVYTLLVFSGIWILHAHLHFMINNIRDLVYLHLTKTYEDYMYLHSFFMSMVPSNRKCNKFAIILNFICPHITCMWKNVAHMHNQGPKGNSTQSLKKIRS